MPILRFPSVSEGTSLRLSSHVGLSRLGVGISSRLVAEDSTIAQNIRHRACGVRRALSPFAKQ
eukprot:8728822-Pyramimonas_sp.AAC.1